jgi:hypothetical protein
MARKPVDFNPQPECPNCGGLHYGSPVGYCPYTKAPCVVCGDPTICACSDCQIDLQTTIHVCGKWNCQDEHEKKHPASTAKEIA